MNYFQSIPKDEKWMLRAITIARRGLGKVFPNPSVGCIVVKNDKIVGSACTSVHQHAETIALDYAGYDANDADLYVTLEPCCHYGRTAPCVNAIIKAKVKRVVIANIDPDPRISGKGIIALRNAGIEVITNCCSNLAEYLDIGHFKRIKEHRPAIFIKLATSLDGKIADKNGNSRWITNELSRNKVHIIRSSMDAIMVGIGKRGRK